MAAIHLRKLTLKAFRSFKDTCTVEFPEKGLVLIRGKNHDTGGSSGSGKSSINLAIAYALGYSPFPATALQSWLTEEPMSVKLELTAKDDEIVIARGEKLSVTINGKKVAGSASLVENKLREALGLSADLLSALTYRAQQERGLFLSKTDSEKKSFLTAVLGLERFEQAVEQAGENIKKLEKDGHATLSQIEPAKLTVDRYRADLQSLTHVDVEPLKTAAKEAEAEHVDAKKRLDNVKEYLQTVIFDRDRELAAIPVVAFEPDMSEVKRVSDLLANVNERIDKLKAADKERDVARLAQLREIGQRVTNLRKRQLESLQIHSQIQSRTKEITKLQQSICPTCERQWDEAQDRIAALAKQNSEDAKTMQEHELALDLLLPLEKEADALSTFEPDPMIEKLGTVKSKLTTDLATAQVAVAGQRQAAEFKRQQQVLAVTQRFESFVKEAQLAVQTQQEEELAARNDLFQAQTSLKAATDSNAREAQRLQQVQQRLGEAEVYLADVEQKASTFKVQIQAEQDFIKLVGREGFLGRIFDEVLDEISTETNEILSGLPNAQHVTVRFASETATQKGTIKKSIVPMVSFNGIEAPLKSGCSGGMLTSVELAVDLAVSSVVSRRAGIVPGWLVLDEAFEGLDIVSKESGMTILSQYAQDRLVLVVDHATEFKEMFTQFVDVELRNGVSSI